MFEWAALGGVIFALFIFSARIMRRGLSTLDDVRHQHLEKIDEGMRKLVEDRKKISADEHIHLLYAAIQDLVRLAPDATDWRLQRDGRIVKLENSAECWEIELLMRERRLKSSSSILHGKPQWILRKGGHEESFSEISCLMSSLNHQMNFQQGIPSLPEHLARRLAGNRAGQDLLHTHASLQKGWKD